MFFLSTADLLFIAIWPLALPFMIIDTLREIPKTADQGAPEPERKNIIGARGIVTIPLRPGGEIEIEGQRFQAITKFGTIAKGEEVEVLERDSLRVIVTKINQH